jgi:hypothetical protein
LIPKEKSATFVIQETALYPSSMQLMSLVHNYWFACQGGKNAKHGHGYEVIMKYTKTDDKYIGECSFYFYPISESANTKKFCKNVIGVEKPSIPKQKFPDDENTYKKTPPALTFLQPRGN